MFIIAKLSFGMRYKDRFKFFNVILENFGEKKIPSSPHNSGFLRV
jgi:hypothetical protein